MATRVYCHAIKVAKTTLTIKLQCPNPKQTAKQSYYLPFVRTNYDKFNLRFQGPSIWNCIDKDIKLSSKAVFKEKNSSPIFKKILASPQFNTFKAVLLYLPIYYCFCIPPIILNLLYFKVQLTVKDDHYTLVSPSTPIPLRPINSSIGSPTYHVSKYLANLLSPLRSDHGYTIKNSKEFADFVETQTVRPDEEIVSFDVVSLFTSIPVDLALKVFQSKLELNHTWKDKTKLTENQIVELTKIVLYNSFFSSEGTLYHQIFGCAMGSCVSVVIADLVMEHVEVQALCRYTNPLET